MGGRVNKYRLKDSDLKESQKRKIRQDAGYGCVICGALFIQYEHIEPEFHDAKEHDPDRMTLLCGTHHDDVSYGRITKEMVWSARANPKNKQGGVISRSLYHQNIDTKIRFGNNYIGWGGAKIFDSMLTIGGKPVLWFESDFEPCAPVRVCAIFHDVDGGAHAYINRNCFITTVSDYDIKAKGTRITISKGRTVILILNFPGGDTLGIERLKMSYKGTLVEVKTNNTLQMQSNLSSLSFDTSEVGRALLSGPQMTRYLREGVYTALALAIRAAINGVRVLSHNGFTLGWITGNLILNKHYFIVSYIKDGSEQVYDVSGEYIGFLSRVNLIGEEVATIVTEGDSYESGEPIYLIPSERKSKNVKNEKCYDLGYRVFVSNEAYPWSIAEEQCSDFLR